MYRELFYLARKATFGALVSTCLPLSAADLPPQAELIEGVLVPVPGEIFRAFDAFPEPNWQRVERKAIREWKPGGSQVRIALRLGVVLSEGFVAVAAEDTSAMQDIGRSALTLARALGIERSILRRSNSILDRSARGDWKAVRAEWSNVEADVRAAMLEINSEQLAQLVSAGGWLRGAEAVAALSLQGYSKQKAAILLQPVILEHFTQKLAATKGRIRKDPLIATLQEGLAKLGPLIGDPGMASVSEQTARDTAAVTRRLLDAIGANP